MMKSIITVAIIFILIGVGAFEWQKTNTEHTELTSNHNTEPAQPKENILQNTDWQKYENETYGFEFSLPPNSTVTTNGYSNYQYIRFQNYVPTDDVMELNAGEYYLEIHIQGEQKNSESESCDTQVVNAKEVEIGVAKGFRGYGQEGGDAGGIRFALCTDHQNNHFYIQGTENDKNAPLVTRIFDSFKFTK